MTHSLSQPLVAGVLFATLLLSVMTIRAKCERSDKRLVFLFICAALTWTATKAYLVASPQIHSDLETACFTLQRFCSAFAAGVFVSMLVSGSWVRIATSGKVEKPSK